MAGDSKSVKMRDILCLCRPSPLNDKQSAEWKALLENPNPGDWSEDYRALAGYLIQRYWLQAVSDYDLYSRVKFTVIACLLVKYLGGDIFRTAQLFSKEIENDADNVDAILDAAYAHPAFTDDKVLGMLMGL